MTLLRRFARPSLAFLGVLLALVAMTSFSTISTVSANGATVDHQNINISECFPYEFTGSGTSFAGEVCFNTRRVVQQVTTPSGGFHSLWIDGGSFSSWDTVVDAGGNYLLDTSVSVQSHFQSIWHVQDGDTQIDIFVLADEAIITDNLTGLVVTCRFEQTFRSANGNVTMDVFFAGCEPTP
jgi:hypothetical protein